MRLIDADKLSYVGNHIGDEYEDRFHDKQWIYRDTIDNAPTIEAEPIVRCKDCKHWNSETKGCKRNPSVEAWCDTDYCSYGERSESHDKRRSD